MNEYNLTLGLKNPGGIYCIFRGMEDEVKGKDLKKEEKGDRRISHRGREDIGLGSSWLI